MEQSFSLFLVDKYHFSVVLYFACSFLSLLENLLEDYLNRLKMHSYSLHKINYLSLNKKTELQHETSINTDTIACDARHNEDK